VGTAFNELAGIEHEDLVGLTHGGQPVRENKRSSPAHQITKAFLDEGSDSELRLEVA
jgi:hypothetical protein